MFALEDASFRVKKACLVDQVSWAVGPGEMVTVIGPNGAGKSTTLRLLSGELIPSVGRVRLEGQNLRELTPLQQARHRAVVTQRAELNFDMPVMEVVLLGRHPFNRGQARRVDQAVARAALEAVDLAAWADRGYLSLSGGERQRVQIARSFAQLAGEPEQGVPMDLRQRAVLDGVQRYWLLDEPTSALDLAHQHRLLRLCRRVAREGVGVLTVLHDLNLALRYADRVVLMDRGRLVASGPTAQVLTPENVSAVYGVEASLFIPDPGGPPQLMVH